MRNYVIINGTNSLTIPGLAIRELPAISKTLMRNQKEEIDGRDGDIITELGYSAYDKTMTIGLYGSYDINQIIAFFNQKGTIVFSDEADKYYNFTILEKIDYDKLVKFRTASVRMHCQPFKYPVSETPVEIEAEYVTATGEDITLNNTGVAALEIGLKGNTYQETTTGKQLLDLDDFLTTAGATYTKVNGKYSITNIGSAVTARYPLNLQPNTKYTLSCNEMTNSTNSLRIQVYEGSTYKYRVVSNSSTEKKVTFTTDSNSSYYMNMTYTGTVAYPLLWENVLLETGDGVSNWEPYTAGASPNPDYPQEVQVVTGDNTIIVGNRNLWDEEWELGLINSSTGAKMSGTATIRTKNYIPVRPNTSVYYLNGTDAMWVFAYDKNKNFLGYATGGSSSVSGVARTTPANCYYLMFQCRSQYGTTYNNNICISYSDSLDGTYTPHQSQEYEINLGKNLYNKANATVTGYNNQNISLQLSLKPNTTYSYNIVDRTYGAIYLYDSSNTQTRLLGNTSGTHLITFTTASNEVKGNFVFYAQNNVDISTYDFTGVQIELGQPTTYSPYFTPIELCKIGTYQDYLYKSGENWYKHTEIGKITLNGSESWNYRNDYQTFYISNATSKGTEAPISNYFKGIASGITSNDNVILFNTTTLFVRYLSMSGVISDFKTWLGTHNTLVYYQLATPTEEQITNAELIEQLEAILNAVSYEDQTNISQENDNMAFILDVSALKKGTDMAVVNNEGNIAAKPIIAVKGNGTLGIYLGNTQMFSLNMTSDITIDTENMEAYDPNTSQLRNRQVTGDYSKFALQPGNNTIKVTGDFTSVTISKYQRWL